MPLVQKLLYFLICLLGLGAVAMYLWDQQELLSILAATTTAVVISVIFLCGKNNFPRFNALLTIGLIICLIGDILLFVPRLIHYTMLCFLLAHIVITYAFTTFYGFNKSVAPMLFSFIVSALTIVYIFPDVAGIELFVIIYGLSLTLMHWQGSVLYTKQRTRGFLLINIGVSLFFISEICSAIYLFSYPDVSLNVIIHITYWLGITTIVHVTTMDAPEVTASSQQSVD